VYIQQLGQLQFKKLCDLTTEERMIKFHVQVRLHYENLSFQVPGVVTIMIINLRKLCDLTTKERVIEFHVRPGTPDLRCKPFAEACCRLLLLLPASLRSAWLEESIGSKADGCGEASDTQVDTVGVCSHRNMSGARGTSCRRAPAWRAATSTRPLPSWTPKARPY